MTDSFRIDPEMIDTGVRLLELPEDELFAILGTQVESSPSMALNYGKQARIITSEATARGRAWFEKYDRNLRRKICEEWGYCEKRGKYKKAPDLIRVLAPLVASAVGLSGAVAGVLVTVTAILLQSGLDKYCGCD
jgi:hypothetical protein